VVVAFDTWVFRTSHRHSGIYNYAKSLLAGFRALARKNADLSMRLFFDPRYSDQAVDLSSSEGTETIKTSFLQFHRLWQLGGVSAAAKRVKADLVFSPTSHTCPFGSIPVVTTIHDVTPLTSPSFGTVANLLERLRLRNAAKFSAKCITDSEHSKRDLVNAYGLSPEKVTVAYLGYDRSIFSNSPVDPENQLRLFKRYGIERPYIFHHGAIQPRKNLVRLIRACEQLWAKPSLRDCQLVLAGPLGWNYEEILSAAVRSRADGKIVFPGALPDEDLACLLKGAALAVIPSLYEGFCLPMVEAMACGVPTIASNASCLPEVSAGMLRYFDPLAVEDIAAKIDEALTSSSLRAKLVERGLKRASEFSWERCAAESLRAFRQSVVRSRAGVS
jgi:glycosyltransferase involved in cell wall biosynthesis